MLAEITALLGASGCLICACAVSIDIWFPYTSILLSTLSLPYQSYLSEDRILIPFLSQAETDQKRGLGIMIFHIEGDFESLVIFHSGFQGILVIY
jgi:hypothetical protein